MVHAISARHIGGSLLDPERGILRGADGTQATLRHKSLDLLLLLLRHSGRVVTRTAILDAVWPGLSVSDDSITQCIVEIRRALGPDAAWLRTVPRRGYILDPAVGAGGAPSPAGQAPAILAVMPFRPLQPDPALAMVAHGVLEGVIGALAALRDPLVLSAATTTRFAALATDPLAVGARLGADYVAAGTVRRMGERVRVGIELAEAQGAVVLWQHAFDIAGAEAVEAQDGVATAIAHALAQRVKETEAEGAPGAEPTADSAAPPA